MAIDVIMPKLGESITEATILEWKKNVGDVVGRDETILEISTDKVDSEVPSPASGTLLEILFKKNDTVPVGEVIARIGEEGEKSTSSASEKEDIKENKKSDDAVINKTPKKAEVKVEKEKFSDTDRFYSPLVRSIAKKENELLLPWYLLARFQAKTSAAQERMSGVGSAVFQLMMLKVAEFIFGPYNETFALVLAVVLLLPTAPATLVLLLLELLSNLILSGRIVVEVSTMLLLLLSNPSQPWSGSPLPIRTSFPELFSSQCI